MMNEWLNESFFNTNNRVILQHIIGKIIQYIMRKTIQLTFMIDELLLLLKGHSRSLMTYKALSLFQTKTHSNCNKSYDIDYKVKVMVILFTNFVITISDLREKRPRMELGQVLK